jgi:hypothetical protein
MACSLAAIEPDPMTEAKPGQLKSRPAGWLALPAIPIAVIAWMAFDEFLLSRFTAPWEHAERTRCIGPVDGDPKWQNTCEEPLNFTYCLIASATREVCRSQRLAPGEGVTDIDAAMAELGGGFVNLRRMACAEPYSVMRKPHPNNKRLEDVCG